jgi:hypothetical protein
MNGDSRLKASQRAPNQPLLPRAVAAPVLVRGDNTIRIELTRVKALVAALTDAAADLAELLASGRVYHA